MSFEQGKQLLGWISFFSLIARIAGGCRRLSCWARPCCTIWARTVRRRLRSVYPGAILATILWWLTTTLFGLVCPEYREL